ncbi:MAG: transketolase C-terminal domain-containing protein [Candidatus Gracilibacteria bacterium]|jgi:transketolase
MNEFIEGGEKISMLKGLSDALIKLAKKHKNLVVLYADFGTKLGLRNFSLAFPDRCFNFGLSEENVVAAAVGFAVRGKIPFVIGFANFAGKAWEQIRSSVCYPNLNIKFVAANAGISAGEDGVGYQATEDISIMRAIPNMKVVSPADYQEAASAVEQAFECFGPVYVRLASCDVPVIFEDGCSFEFGKAKVLRGRGGVGEKVSSEKKDICIFTHGAVVSEVLKAVEILEGEGKSVAVVNCSSVKPIDEEVVLRAGRGAGVSVVVEDHNLNGGLFSAVAEVFAGNSGGIGELGVLGPLKGIGLSDRFGESGKHEDLYKKYGLDAEGIAGRIREFLL